MYKMEKEILEFELNDNEIDNLIEKLIELKNSKSYAHYNLPKIQINVIGDDIEIGEFFIDYLGAGIK